MTIPMTVVKDHAISLLEKIRMREEHLTEFRTRLMGRAMKTEDKSAQGHYLDQVRGMDQELSKLRLAREGLRALA